MFSRSLLLSFLLIPSLALAQTEPLDRYIEEGLLRNLALKQKEFSFEQSLRTLDEARGMFLPSISFEARYSRAGGGRLIEIPIGDLMNPVYQTLNELLVAQGQSPKPFPTLENEIVPFLREEEHETKVRLVQPIFQPSIYYNYKIQSNLSRAREAEKDAYRRQLIADMKASYFNFLKTVHVVRLLNETRSLIEENLRVSESLFRNGKATQDVVFRARAEMSELDQARIEAERDRKLAAAYFNFLLNRPLDADIEMPVEQMTINEQVMGFEEVELVAFERREELKQLRNAIEAASNNVRLATSTFLPAVIFVLDYGIQGEYYRFSDEDDFWMGSLLLEWNLFDGFQKRAKRGRAVVEKKQLEMNLQELQNQIRLQLQEAFDNLAVAKKAIASAEDRVSSAQKSFDIIRKKYSEGMSPQIEFLDARTSLTNAQVNWIIAQHDYHIKYAELERVAALSDNEYW